MPPRSSGRIVPYEGLPPGWEAIQKDYLQGTMAGKSYIRFQNDKHKSVGSVRAALKLYAADNNLDADQVLVEYDTKKADTKAKEQQDRESKGFLQGQKRDEAVEVFRSKFGKLDGATVCAIPGWRGESKLLEKSQQISARYYAPNGDIYALLINIEAMWGLLIQNGEDIPDIEAARASLVYDEKGRAVNVARRENVLTEYTEEAPLKRKRHDKESLLVAGETDYRETKFIKVFRLRTSHSSEQLEVAQVADREEVEKDAEHIHEMLTARGFSQGTELLYVSGSNNSRTVVGRKIIDSLRGIYHQRPGKVNERPYYQRVYSSESNANVLGCHGHRISWSATQQLWKIGDLDENKAGYAVNRQDKPHPAELDAAWAFYFPNQGETEDAAEEGAQDTNSNKDS